MASNATSEQKQEAKTQKEILRQLAELGGKQHDDDDIVYGGDKLTIPKGMTIERTIRFLQQKRDDQETENEYVKIYNYRPWDGAYCLQNALKRQFGTSRFCGTCLGAACSRTYPRSAADSVGGCPGDPHGHHPNPGAHRGDVLGQIVDVPVRRTSRGSTRLVLVLSLPAADSVQERIMKVTFNGLAKASAKIGVRIYGLLCFALFSGAHFGLLIAYLAWQAQG